MTHFLTDLTEEASERCSLIGFEASVGLSDPVRTSGIGLGTPQGPLLLPLMDPKRLLQRMCARHSLPYEKAEALLPLIRRALISPFSVRDRILALVDRNLSGQISGASVGSTLSAIERDLDEEVLMSVAPSLHMWKQAGKPTSLGDDLPGIFPDGLDLGLDS
ncbi:MAG: hypothetical protein ACI89E_001875 [Planctomycetota bacterium]